MFATLIGCWPASERSEVRPFRASSAAEGVYPGFM